MLAPCSRPSVPKLPRRNMARGVRGRVQALEKSNTFFRHPNMKRLLFVHAKCIHYWISFILLMLFGASTEAIAECTDKVGIFPWQFARPFDKTLCPAIGHINGIKVSIPKHYLFAGVQYVGEDVWSGKRRNFTPTFDSEIFHFALLLRFKTMRPIENEQDWKDHGKSQGEVVNNLTSLWVRPGFDSNAHDIKKPNLEPVFQNKINKGYFGPWEMQNEEVFNMKHYKSTGLSNMTLSEPDRDLYYSDKNSGTIIECERYHNHDKTLILTSCRHLFMFPELGSSVKVEYPEEYLNQWEKIENALKQIGLSFKVDQ
ncbi:MAG: hypothetical protein HQL56_17510 [Magnetococcales bacterium]|nr:hypothetical protein [Magnetococcales bacterium]